MRPRIGPSAMDENSLLTVLAKILAQPTAPFHEYSVRAAIAELLYDKPDIHVRIDHFGNLLAHYEGTPSPPRWAFGSHMDHPGWVRSIAADTPGLTAPDTRRQRDGFSFLGGVPDAYFDQPAAIRDFGGFAMWDLVDFELSDGIVHSRACDDLAGCAAIVSTLLQLQAMGAPTSCVGIFTRAEEVGFVGAIELAKSWPLPQDCVFVSVETSVATDRTKMGGGPIGRVGDRLSIFDSSATATLLGVAAEDEIPIQRALLDRGACEATALQSYGITTAGISIPLGNYHNCGEGNMIMPENVSLADLENLVRLLTAVAIECPDGPRDTITAQREHLEKRAAGYLPYAEASDAKFLA